MTVITFDARHIHLTVFERITCYFHLQSPEQSPFNLYRQATAASKCAERVGLARAWNGREVIFKSERLGTGCLKMQYFFEGERPISYRQWFVLCFSVILKTAVCIIELSLLMF